MIIIVLDKDRDDLECYEEGDESLYEDILSNIWTCEKVKTYFISVEDKTWKKLADWDSIRLNMSEEEVKEYLDKTRYGMGYVFIYKDGKVKKCVPS